MSMKIHWKVPFDDSEFKQFKKASKTIIGWDKVIGKVWDASNELIRCEIADRARRRSELLKIKEKETHFKRLENSYHLLSIGHLKQSLELFEEADKKLDAKKKQELGDIKEDLSSLRSETLDYIREELLNKDIDPEDASEIIQIYEEIFNVVEKEGFNGLKNKIKKNLNELIEIRSDETKNRGRGVKHSPIAWWKWLLIAAALGLGIGTLIGCLIWQGCAWIFQIIVGTSAPISAICATGC